MVARRRARAPQLVRGVTQTYTRAGVSDNKRPFDPVFNRLEEARFFYGKFAIPPMQVWRGRR